MQTNNKTSLREVKYKMKQGVTYTMFNGVPYELVTETKENKLGVTLTTKFVPAPRVKQTLQAGGE